MFRQVFPLHAMHLLPSSQASKGASRGSSSGSRLGSMRCRLGTSVSRMVSASGWMIARTQWKQGRGQLQQMEFKDRASDIGYWVQGHSGPRPPSETLLTWSSRAR